jgi:hypothetical protein
MSEAQAKPATLPVPVQRKPQEIRVVSDPIPVLDTARFEHMQRIASVMAHSNLVPDALCKTKNGDQLVALEPQEIISNCFLVVNQAVRWGMDPFAVAQCVSVVHGKLCYEGKLIAAVLDAKLGVKLEYEFSGTGDAMKVVVSGTIDGRLVADSKGNAKTVEGTVAEWQTSGSGSPWKAAGGRVRMLRYRGAREWARVYESSVMLGVYSDDEMDALSHDGRSRRAKDISPPSDDEPPPPPSLVPAIEHVDDVARVASGRYDPNAPDEWGDEPPSPETRSDVSAEPARSDGANSVATGGRAASALEDLLAAMGKLTGNVEAADWAGREKNRIAALSPADKKTFDVEFLKKQGEFSKAFRDKLEK